MRNVVMRILIAVLALAGAYDSTLALKVHNEDPGLAPPCQVTAQWDCGTVNHSRFSYFPAKTFDEAEGTRHIPVATLGIAGYLGMFLLAAFGLFRVLLPISFGGVCFAGYLTYLESQVIHKWCIYCVVSQSIVLGVFLATVVALMFRGRGPRQIEMSARPVERTA